MNAASPPGSHVFPARNRRSKLPIKAIARASAVEKRATLDRDVGNLNLDEIRVRNPVRVTVAAGLGKAGSLVPPFCSLCRLSPGLGGLKPRKASGPSWTLHAAHACPATCPQQKKCQSHRPKCRRRGEVLERLDSPGWSGHALHESACDSTAEYCSSRRHLALPTSHVAGTCCAPGASREEQQPAVNICATQEVIIAPPNVAISDCIATATMP
ncbi:hypothetical protein B0J14DRAFT_558835 [Halenospora varia]|nr:hypothetical protein B0J14DRAFT_558835 [Halenospora varia]